ncbi:MAG: extensin family protein [Deltaproteobacteria bacterium]|nr:extensin family protein [Deltaproteobacteria bacterium]
MIRKLLSLPLLLVAATAHADGSPQWANAAGADGAKCLAELKAAFNGSAAKFTAHAPMTKPNKQGCGMPQGVTVTRGPAGITWSPALEIDCTLAAELPKIEAIVQEEARALLGGEIKRIETLGAYACRTSKGPLTTAYGGKGVLSEHAFGLAIDLKAFVPKKGKAVTIAKDWGKDTKAGEFLANVRYRLRKETAITHVITPDYNAAHRDHLHVDRGLPWGWWAP